MVRGVRWGLAGGSRCVLSHHPSPNLHTPAVCLPSAACWRQSDQHNCINKIGKDYSNLDKTYLVIYFITQTPLNISLCCLCWVTAGSELANINFDLLLLGILNTRNVRYIHLLEWQWLDWPPPPPPPLTCRVLVYLDLPAVFPPPDDGRLGTAWGDTLQGDVAALRLNHVGAAQTVNNPGRNWNKYSDRFLPYSANRISTNMLDKYTSQSILI